MAVMVNDLFFPEKKGKIFTSEKVIDTHAFGFDRT
jgi:hypothetical protein